MNRKKDEPGNDKDLLEIQSMFREALGKELENRNIHYLFTAIKVRGETKDGYDAECLNMGSISLAKVPDIFVLLAAVQSDDRELLQKASFIRTMAKMVGHELEMDDYDHRHDKNFVHFIENEMHKLSNFVQSKKNMSYALMILMQISEDTHGTMGAVALGPTSPPHFYLSHYLSHLALEHNDIRIKQILTDWQKGDGWQAKYHDEIQSFIDGKVRTGKTEFVNGSADTTITNVETGKVVNKVGQTPEEADAEQRLRSEGVSANFDTPVDAPADDLRSQVRRLLGMLGDESDDEE